MSFENLDNFDSFKKEKQFIEELNIDPYNKEGVDSILKPNVENIDKLEKELEKFNKLYYEACTLRTQISDEAKDAKDKNDSSRYQRSIEEINALNEIINFYNKRLEEVDQAKIPLQSKKSMDMDLN